VARIHHALECPASSGAQPLSYLCLPPRGLKGTSKSVMYRCIWNENLIFQPKSSGSCTPLDRDNLQNLTFCLSFQYGTATKAPRLPAVLQYSARLSNVAMGYVEYLFLGTSLPGYDVFQSPPGVDDIYRKADGDSRVLPAFNPFLADRENPFHLGSSVPFHPHVSA
jgi:hypothetical protein